MDTAPPPKPRRPSARAHRPPSTLQPALYVRLHPATDARLRLICATTGEPLCAVVERLILAAPIPDAVETRAVTR